MSREAAEEKAAGMASEMDQEAAAGTASEMKREAAAGTSSEMDLEAAAGTSSEMDLEEATRMSSEMDLEAVAETNSGTAIKRESDIEAGAGTMAIREDERIDDLERNGYRIIQKKKGFCFGMDAVLLSGFARAFKGEHVLDIGTGTGIIPILMEAKTEGETFTGLEVQAEIADMARRSVDLNGLGKKIKIITGDIRGAGSLFLSASFDVITSNPPYMDHDHGLENPDRVKAISRHEILCTLEDVVREAGWMVRPGGRFYLVHRPHRLIQIVNVLSKYRLEPKRMKFVHPYVDREANMVLIEAVRGGKPMLKLEKPVIVFKEPGVYTDEMKDIYGY